MTTTKALIAAYRACLKMPIGTLERVDPSFQAVLAFLRDTIADQLGLSSKQVQTAFEQMGDE